MSLLTRKKPTPELPTPQEGAGDARWVDVAPDATATKADSVQKVASGYSDPVPPNPTAKMGANAEAISQGKVFETTESKAKPNRGQMKQAQARLDLLSEFLEAHGGNAKNAIASLNQIPFAERQAIIANIDAVSKELTDFKSNFKLPDDLEKEIDRVTSEINHIVKLQPSFEDYQKSLENLKKGLWEIHKIMADGAKTLAGKIGEK